jgi:predicted Zn-dependent protease
MTNKRLAVLEKMTAADGADSFAWYGLALEYKKEQRPDDALRAFETLRAKDPQYLPMFLMAGQLLIELGRFEQAREWLAAGIELARTKGDSKALSELTSALQDAAD